MLASISGEQPRRQLATSQTGSAQRPALPGSETPGLLRTGKVTMMPVMSDDEIGEIKDERGGAFIAMIGFSCRGG